MAPGSLLGVQLRWCLATVALVCGSYAGGAALSQSTLVSDWLLERQLAKWSLGNSRFAFTGPYVDAGECLLLDVLPNADYSRGGVYFLGSSTMLHATKLWELPAGERALIHNYAVNSANVDEELQWIRYLIEEEGLLSAGGSKTRVILGLNAFDTRMKRPGSSDEKYVDELFTRHGLYRYDADKGISRVDMAAILRSWTLTRLRAQNLILSLSSHLDFPTSKPDAPAFDSQAQADRTREHLAGGRFDEDLAFSLPILARTLDYLREHEVDVVGVLLPIRSWSQRLPFHARFARSVESLFEERSLRLVDLSTLLRDEDFFDAGHANFKGQSRLHAVLIELAREHTPTFDNVSGTTP